MILFILEAHGALHFGGGVDKTAKQIAGQRMVITAGIYILELLRLVIVALGIRPLEKEAFNLVCRVQRVAFLLVQLLRETLQRPANVGAIRRAILVDDFAE